MKKLLILILAFMATTATLFADSGSCGANVNWDLTGGVLTISGTGYMTSYTSPSKRPWHSFASSITSVVIEEGVMNIGESAFEDFSSLTSVTIPNSLEVIEGYAFFGCSALSSVTIPDNIMTIGNSTFKYCSALTTITIPANVNYIKYQAFSGCTGLTEIICEATTPPTCEDLVFEGVTNTIPVYVPAESVSAYKSASGWNYFENIQAKGAGPKEIYAALSGSTMTIYFDDQKASRPGALDKWTPESGVDMDDATRNLITKAVIDASMEDALPTITMGWFYNLENLTTIEGLANLNTSEVTDMSAMFASCSSLTSLDLSNFNTSNVMNMSYMFWGCYSLTSLDLSSFHTDKVENMIYMLAYCTSLSSLDISSFNTANVTSMMYMFQGCSSLTSLDLSGFNMSSVTGMDGMFQDCSSLTSLDVSNFNTANVTNMYGLFNGCSSLTELDLSGFHTDNVMMMAVMFQGCSSLTELDLSGFNTSSVWNMDGMFSDCSALKTIYCDDDWSASSVLEDSENMFDGCTALVGGKGTKYDAGKKDKTYARPDGLDDKPGYFTAKGAGSKEIYAALSGSTMTIYFDDQKACPMLHAKRLQRQ